MIEKRNIEIVSGDLSIGADNLFDEIADADQVNLHIQKLSNLELSKGSETQLKVQLSAAELDQLAIEWCKKRNLTSQI